MIAFQQEPVRSAFPTMSVEADVVSRMAQEMIERADHGVDEQALIHAGFTRAEIAAHSAEAIDLANLTGRAG